MGLLEHMKTGRAVDGRDVSGYDIVEYTVKTLLRYLRIERMERKPIYQDAAISVFVTQLNVDTRSCCVTFS